MKRIIENLEYIKTNLILPDIFTLESAPTPEVVVGGQRRLLFCSNNYLGLSTHPDVKSAAIAAINKYGVGSGASRLISGTYDVHRELERTLASFKGTEDAMVFSAGFSTNVSVIPAIMDLFAMKVRPLTMLFGRGVILSDELNHASIVDGCRLSRCKTAVYNHRDTGDLRRLLKRHRRRRKMIVTDGVFSMDGDIAPLGEIAELAKEYGSMLMVDEAHSTGTLGLRGSGAVELHGVEGDVDVIMGTLSKGLGAIGGYIAGRHELVEFLRIAARGYMFATAFPPHIAAAVIEAIEVIRRDSSIVRRLHENSEYLRHALQARGFDTLLSETQIIPVLVGDEMHAIQLSKGLYNRGFLTGCARWPAVPRGNARIRLSLMATHTRNHLDRLLEALTELGEEIGVIS